MNQRAFLENPRRSRRTPATAWSLRARVACDASSLRCEAGRVRCPSGPGFGVALDPDWVAKAVRVKEAS